MLFEFSKRLLVLSVLAGVLYYLMTYPMVFEKVRKYLPFKFNNTKSMLIFNSVVFSLVMYFVGVTLLKSGLDYSGEIVKGSANWNTVTIKCGEDLKKGDDDRLCANKMSFKITANYDNGFNAKGDINNNIIRWGDDNTIWTKYTEGPKEYIEEPWVDPLPVTWGYIKDGKGVSCSQTADVKLFRTQANCRKNLSLIV